MRLFYTLPHPDIIDACMDADYLTFDTTLLSSDEVFQYTIDEIPENANLIRDILQTKTQVDDAGQKKYYIQAGELFERDNWTARDEWQN